MRLNLLFLGIALHPAREHHSGLEKSYFSMPALEKDITDTFGKEMLWNLQRLLFDRSGPVCWSTFVICRDRVFPSIKQKLDSIEEARQIMRPDHDHNLWKLVVLYSAYEGIKFTSFDQVSTFLNGKVNDGNRYTGTLFSWYGNMLKVVRLHQQSFWNERLYRACMTSDSSNLM